MDGWRRDDGNVERQRGSKECGSEGHGQSMRLRLTQSDELCGTQEIEKPLSLCSSCHKDPSFPLLLLLACLLMQ